jgi:DNA-binding NarL/FixJ family response regulator
VNTYASGRPGDRLTARELQVLAAIANGREGRQIARMLHISPNTVKSHTSRIYRKLGAADRAHAVGLAIATRQLAPKAIAVVIEPTRVSAE